MQLLLCVLSFYLWSTFIRFKNDFGILFDKLDIKKELPLLNKWYNFFANKENSLEFKFDDLD